MKKITSYLKTFALACLLAGSARSVAQCTASFVPVMGINGNVSFAANAVGYSSVTLNAFYWNFGNGVTNTGTNVTQTATTYTANGIYTITLTYVNSAGTCTSVATQTVNVTNATGCNLNPSFSYYNNISGGPGAINFTNLSTGLDPGATYTWIFGDGSPNSTTASPTHTYASGGTYPVKLIINNNSIPSCVDSVTVFVFVCSLQASFTSTLFSNGSVGFTSTSANTGTFTNYYWTFGDGNTYSNTNAAGASTTHTYVTNNSFTVTLWLATSGCSSTASSTVTVGNVVAPCGLNTGFNYNQGSNGTVNFFNSTSGASGGVTYAWAFGDGGTSASTSPSHVYAANGTYIATLTANNNYSYSCTGTTTAAIVVTSYCNLSAGISPNMGANGNVTFNNTTTGTMVSTSYLWNFGDGGTSSLPAPSHIYAANGTYTVTLFATNNNTVTPCTSTGSAVITVTNACVADASFSMSPSGTPQVWNAFPISPSGIISATWNWGDGSGSNTLYTSHTYSAAGTYSICLTVSVSCGDSDTSCFSYAIYRTANASQDMNVIRIDVIDLATVGVKDLSAGSQGYEIYPNPNNGSFNLSLKGLGNGKVTIGVYDLVGRLVYQAEGSSNGSFTRNIELDNVSNGAYFIKITADNKTFTKKVIISGQ